MVKQCKIQQQKDNTTMIITYEILQECLSLINQIFLPTIYTRCNDQYYALAQLYMRLSKQYADRISPRMHQYNSPITKQTAQIQTGAIKYQHI